MKKLTLITLLAILLTGCCLSQLPTQYVYADTNCIAILPDFRGMVVVSDNCNAVNIIQEPIPGDPITESTLVFIKATDDQGNETAMSFDVLILDTIPPLMQLNPEWQGYSNTDIGNMYKVYYGWVQEMGDYYNEQVAGTVDTIYAFDSMYVHTNDTMRYFNGTIPIFEYRIDQGYWSNETPDLTAWFK